MNRPAALSAAAALMATVITGGAQAQVVYYGAPVVAPAVIAPAVPTPVVSLASPVLSYAPVTAAMPLTVQSFYRVKAGGKLQAVAKRTGVSLADLVSLNPHLSPHATLPAGTMVGLPIP